MVSELEIKCYVYVYSCSFMFYNNADVVGFFSAVGVEKQYERNGSMTKMNVIELEDNG